MLFRIWISDTFSIFFLLYSLSLSYLTPIQSTLLRSPFNSKVTSTHPLTPHPHSHPHPHPKILALHFISLYVPPTPTPHTFFLRPITNRRRWIIDYSRFSFAPGFLSFSIFFFMSFDFLLFLLSFFLVFLPFFLLACTFFQLHRVLSLSVVVQSWIFYEEQ